MVGFSKAYFSKCGAIQRRAQSPTFQSPALGSRARRCASLENARTPFAKVMVRLALIVTLAGLFEFDPAMAQDGRQNAPGEFDFYVLSLSWSPSFCDAASERGNSGRNQQAQCGGRPFSFVVHGLWPQ